MINPLIVNCLNKKGLETGDDPLSDSSPVWFEEEQNNFYIGLLFGGYYSILVVYTLKIRETLSAIVLICREVLSVFENKR